jgi:hypothetical protein
MKAVVVETFDQGGTFSQREKDDRRTQFIRRVFRAQCGRHSHDTTAFLPYFSIVAVCALPCLLDGFLIVSAFKVFDAQKAAVMTEAKDAICGHAAHSLSQAGARPNSQPPTPGLKSHCRGYSLYALNILRRRTNSMGDDHGSMRSSSRSAIKALSRSTGVGLFHVSVWLAPYYQPAPNRTGLSPAEQQEGCSAFYFSISIVLFIRHPMSINRQAVAYPKVAHKSGTYRSLRYLELAALVPSAGTITF